MITALDFLPRSTGHDHAVWFHPAVSGSIRAVAYGASTDGHEHDGAI